MTTHIRNLFTEVQFTIFRFTIILFVWAIVCTHSSIAQSDDDDDLILPDDQFSSLDDPSQNKSNDASSTPEEVKEPSSETSRPVIDPFFDYSEEEISSEEEADISFFRRGRLASLHIWLGKNYYTENLKNLYFPGLNIGLEGTYFFDLDLGFYFSYILNEASYLFKFDNTEVFGNSTWSFFSIGFKYYIESERLIRFLSFLNPFVRVGAHQVNRNLSLNVSQDIFISKALGFEGGIGIEIYSRKKQLSLGAGVNYRYFSLPDEREPIINPQTLVATDIFPSGDSFDFYLGVGFTF